MINPPVLARFARKVLYQNTKSIKIRKFEQPEKEILEWNGSRLRKRKPNHLVLKELACRETFSAST